MSGAPPGFWPPPAPAGVTPAVPRAAAPAAARPAGPGPDGGGLRGVPFRLAVLEVFAGFADRLPAGAGREEAVPAAARAAADWAAARVRDGGAVLAAADRERLARAVLDEQFGLGPLQPFIDDGEVENLDINGPGTVWARRSGGRKTREDPVAASSDDLVSMVRTWGLRQSRTQREFSSARPLLNAALGGTVRLSAVMSVTRDVHVSVRFHRLRDVTLGGLRDLGMVSPVLERFLAAAVTAHKNVLVTGGVDAGKTTLLRALCAAAGPDERLATLETDRELHLDLLPARHRDVIAMEARQANSEGAGAITVHDLIPQVLRMNPRRIIVGEVRDTEIVPMLEAMCSGQEGSMATLHASGPAEVYPRVLMLAQRGAAALSQDSVSLAVGLARPLVVHVRKDPAGTARYVSEVAEILPGDGGRPARNTVFAAGPDGRAVPARSASPELMRDLDAAGLDPAVLAGGVIA